MAELLVENYIEHILDRPHSIFHLPTLRRSVHDGTLAPALRCALLSYGARFHPDAEVSDLSKQFLEEAKTQLHADLENVCLENVQTCILLASLSAAEMQPSSEALYLSVGVHMGEILQLGVRIASDAPETQELKRRIWCSLYMADLWCSTGNGLGRKMSNFNCTTDLPIDEAIFHGSATLPPSSGEMSQPGLWTYMITLVAIFDQIQELNKDVVRRLQTTSNALLVHVDEEVTILGDALTSWETNLPEHVRHNETNLLKFRAQGLGGPFVALHQGYYHYSMLLYYQYLDSNRAATSMTNGFSKVCKQHAFAHSNLLSYSRTIGDCDVFYAGVGHSTVISSSVLLHTALFGDPDEISLAQKALQNNFKVLHELSQYWPSLELTIRRLSQFQMFCTDDDALSAYNFDDWMVAFLLRYHLALYGNRAKNPPSGDTTSSMPSLSRPLPSIRAER